jgi:hypothetical protein
LGGSGEAIINIIAATNSTLFIAASYMFLFQQKAFHRFPVIAGLESIEVNSGWIILGIPHQLMIAGFLMAVI